MAEAIVKTRRKPRPIHAPRDAVSVAELYDLCAYLMDQGYEQFPVMWSEGGHFGYVRHIEKHFEKGLYHRGITVCDR